MFKNSLTFFEQSYFKGFMFLMGYTWKSALVMFPEFDLGKALWFFSKIFLIEVLGHYLLMCCHGYFGLLLLLQVVSSKFWR
jgi:hypothetical protein